MRGRNRNNKGPNPLTRSYESNGPDVKIRGTAQHIAEKYSQLSRDAQASGDPVAAENYLQHAEHYYRIIAVAQEQLREQYGYQERPDDGDEDGFEGNRPYGSGEEGDFGSQPQPYDGGARFERPERQDRQGQDRQGGGRTGRGRIGSRTAPSGRTASRTGASASSATAPRARISSVTIASTGPSVRIANRSARSASRGRSVRSGASSGASAAVRPKRPRAMPAACRPS